MQAFPLQHLSLNILYFMYEAQFSQGLECHILSLSIEYRSIELPVLGQKLLPKVFSYSPHEKSVLESSKAVEGRVTSKKQME